MVSALQKYRLVVINHTLYFVHQAHSRLMTTLIQLVIQLIDVFHTLITNQLNHLAKKKKITQDMNIMYFTAQINYSFQPNHTLKCQSFITSFIFCLPRQSFLLKARTLDYIHPPHQHSPNAEVGRTKCKQPEANGSFRHDIADER